MVRQYAERWPYLAQLANAPGLFEDAELAALLHDLGKAAVGFQAVLQGHKEALARSWGHYRHEILSGALVATLPHSPRRDDLLLAVLTHHLGMNKDSFGGPALYRFAPKIQLSIFQNDWNSLIHTGRNFGKFSNSWRHMSLVLLKHCGLLCLGILPHYPILLLYWNRNTLVALQKGIDDHGYRTRTSRLSRFIYAACWWLPITWQVQRRRSTLKTRQG